MIVRKQQLVSGNEININIDGVPLGLGMLRNKVGITSLPFNQENRVYRRQTWMVEVEGDLMNLVFSYEDEFEKDIKEHD